MINLSITDLASARIILYSLRSRQKAYGMGTWGHDVFKKLAENLEWQIADEVLRHPEAGTKLEGSGV